jgi:Phosphomannomutase
MRRRALEGASLNAAHSFDLSILREYDVRGVFGKTLGPDDARAIGRSFASVVRRGGGARIAVGYDGRTSSPTLEAALVEGIVAAGVDAVRIGLSTSPMLYFAEATGADIDAAVEVTGSHNPRDHNGFKFVLRGGPFFGSDITALGMLAAAGDWEKGNGACEDRDVLHAYVARLIQALDGLDVGGLRNLRIGWDAGNGAAGPAVEALVRLLPGQHHVLFSEVDGTFPNHHPDPTIDANLADLRALVEREALDFGVAFDGDADRIGVIDGKGRAIAGDQLIGLFAEDLLLRRPGTAVIADVKASAMLFERVAALGGDPVMWKSGHSHIKAKMKETGALLGGEMSGHVFFADEYYGYDDGLYAAVRLMAAVARAGNSVTSMREAMPQTMSTPEIRFEVAGQRKFAIVEEVRARLASQPVRVNDIDGVRVDSPDGWWLLRASNTQDALTARAESSTQSGLARLLAHLDQELALSGSERPL